MKQPMHRPEVSLISKFQILFCDCGTGIKNTVTLTMPAMTTFYFLSLIHQADTSYFSTNNLRITSIETNSWSRPQSRRKMGRLGSCAFWHLRRFVHVVALLFSIAIFLAIAGPPTTKSTERHFKVLNYSGSRVELYWVHVSGLINVGDNENSKCIRWFLTYSTLSRSLSLNYSPTLEKASWCQVLILLTVPILLWIHLSVTNLKSESYHRKEPDCVSQKIKYAETVSLRYQKTRTKVSIIRSSINLWKQ